MVLSDKEILYDSSDRNRELFRGLGYLINLEIEDDIVRDILQKKELEPAFAEINRFRNLYTVKLETEHANEILSSVSPWAILEKFPFYETTLNLSARNIKVSGFLPGTGFSFSEAGRSPELTSFFQAVRGKKHGD